MLQQILTGQAKSISLLLWAAFLFVYFLPSVLAFRRGHRHFFIILVLNVLVSPVQGVILHYVWPDILVVDPHNPLNVALAAGIANLGVGWILLMIWTLRPGESDSSLLKFRETKYYDAIAALPLRLRITASNSPRSSAVNFILCMPSKMEHTQPISMIQWTSC